MLSLQYHRQKDETLLVVKGAMDLQLEDDGGQLQTHRLTPGMARRIVPGRRHRMIGVEECEFFEVSSPEIDDVVRLKINTDGREPAPPNSPFHTFHRAVAAGR